MSNTITIDTSTAAIEELMVAHDESRTHDHSGFTALEQAARDLVPALATERDALRRENEQLRAEIAELDFLRHEGGTESVGAMESMLRGSVLPILRAYAEDLLRCVSLGNDPATITGTDWRDIADVLDAVCEAERFVGRPDDEYGALLNPVLDARTWEGHR